VSLPQIGGSLDPNGLPSRIEQVRAALSQKEAARSPELPISDVIESFPAPVPTGFETEELSPWGFTPAPPLPFRQSGAPSPMAQPSGAAGARPSNTDVMEEYTEEDPNMRTGMMPGVGFSASAPTPWSAPMSVEEYASLCAEAAVFPHRLVAIYANRQIRTPEQARLLHGEFMARFRASPALHQRWTELVATTTAILRRAGGAL
jgi:hypothetical protein